MLPAMNDNSEIRTSYSGETRSWIKPVVPVAANVPEIIISNVEEDTFDYILVRFPIYY